MLDFRQTDEKLPTMFLKYGCHVCTLGSMVNTLTRATITQADLMYALIDGMLYGYVEEKAYVRNPNYLLRGLLEGADLHKQYSIYQIGADGQFWMWVKYRDYQATVLKYVTKNENNHFIEGDVHENMLYNPDPNVELKNLQSVLYYQVRRNF